LEIFHDDLMGHFPHLSINKARYLLTFIYDYLRNTWVYFLRTKYEGFEYLKYFKAHAKTQSEKMIKILRTNNGE